MISFLYTLTQKKRSVYLISVLKLYIYTPNDASLRRVLSYQNRVCLLSAFFFLFSIVNSRTRPLTRTINHVCVCTCVFFCSNKKRPPRQQESYTFLSIATTKKIKTKIKINRILKYYNVHIFLLWSL